MKMNFNRILYTMLYLSNVPKKLKLKRRSRCSKYRKYPECDFQVKAIFSDAGGITVSTSNAHNHAHRVSTTRAPSPVREIVINAAAAGLSQIQTRRAVQHQYQGVVSRTQLASLLNYHRSLTVPIHSYYLFFKLNKLLQAQNNG